MGLSIARFLALAWLCVSLSAFAAPSLVWFSSSDNLFQINGDSNTVTQTLPIKAIGQLAVDSQGAAWAVTEKQLSKLGTNGTALFQADFKTLGLQTEPSIAVDPYDNSIWVADNKTVLHLDTNGQRHSAFPAPFADVRQMHVSLDQTLWILGNKQLAHHAASGAALATFDLHAVTAAEPKFFIVDDLGGGIWLAGEKELIQVDLATANHVQHRIALGDTVLGLVLQPKTGAVWALSKDNLVVFDSTGTPVRNSDLKNLAIKGADTLVFDPLGDSAWMTHDAGIARFSASGNLIARIATQKAAQEISAAPFTLLPEISLVSPANGLLTNNPTPRFVLQYDASCNGQPCGFTTTYLGTYSLNALLNGQAAGNLLAFDLASGKANFTPASRLPEGINTFTAQVRDSFGHLSNSVNSNFTIDTIPPKFTTLSPSDNATSNLAGITLTGSVDEEAQIRLTTDSGTYTDQGRNFSFPISLKPGQNTLTLTATDRAGNQSTTTLKINFAAGLKLTILSPQNGATVSGTYIVVNGTFEGPDNTGITVNEVAAAKDGKQFYGRVPLEQGVNTVTVTATTLDGLTVSKTLTLTNNGSSPFIVNVEPASGVAPLQAVFTVEARSAQAIAKIEADFDGNGAVDFTTVDSSVPIQFTYVQPGAYQAKVTVTDSNGAAYSETVVVVVNDPVQVDRQLKAIWSGLNQSLASGDKSAALQYLNTRAKSKYGPVFDALLPTMPQIIGSYSAPQLVSLSAEIGEYAINRTIDGVNRLFLIYFLQDADGVWRIDSM